MYIRNVRKNITNGKVILSAEVESKKFSHTQSIFFCYSENYYDNIPENGDPFLPAALIPAMTYGEDLILDVPISQKILNKQSLIQDIFTTWYPDAFKRINVLSNAGIDEPELKSKNRNATFFSLGVDSMYTMLKYHKSNNPPPGKELTSLIYMKGLELPLSVYNKRQDIHVIQSIKNLASHYQLDVIIGETNIRDVFPLGWDTSYSGPGLSSVALSLSKGFDNFYIPSSHSYANLAANPSSPLTDGLWSNEHTKIIHDGSEVERAEKIERLIMKDAFALNKLRVCVDNDGGDYNCGKCWKCVRTMVTLKILGCLKKSGSFPDTLPPGYTNSLRTYLQSSLKFTKENLNLARRYNDKELEELLNREIRIGKLDLIRDNRSIYFICNEMFYYYWWKLMKKLGFS